MKKFFKILLVGFMLTTGMFTTVYAEPDENGENTEVLPADETSLQVEDVDPSTLNVHKLGEDINVKAQKDPEPLYGDEEIVRVSIVLESPATLDVYDADNVAENDEAMAYRESLADEQATVTKRIERKLGEKLDVEWNLTLATNIISANVAYGDIETIKNVYGVDDVFVENRYEVMEDEINTSISTEYMVYASYAWEDGYTGAGSRVAVIDTGVNQDHISFDPDALIYSLEGDDGNYDEAVADYNLLTPEEIEGVLDQLNDNNTDSKHNISSAEYVYKNAKLPFAFNYVDGNNTTDHFSDDEGNHGSHVAGIAAANRYVKVDGDYVESLEQTHAVGVAPDAQILVMKVFGKGGGAYDSDFMAAIEDAIILKADSVNLSLGTANPGFTFAGAYQKTMENLVNSSTVVVFSAGNAYHWSANSNTPYGDLYLDDISLATNGSSGSYANTLSVASATNVGYTGKPLVFEDSKFFYSEPAEADFGNKPISTLAGEQEFLFVVGYVNEDGELYKLATGTDEEFAAVGDVLDGKIGMCFRGTTSFYQKANAAVKNGAIAAVIVNNQKGLINMTLKGNKPEEQYEYTAPVIMIQYYDGLELLYSSSVEEYLTDNGLYYITGTIEVTDVLTSEAQTAREDAEIDDYSSWGVSGSLILKPEITAPGGNIWSVEGMSEDEYVSYSGTSMAAPHISGMAAILAQYFRESEEVQNLLENTEGLTARTLMNSLLMSTATPMINDYGLYYPVLQQGAGLGDVYTATQAKSYIMMREGSTLLSSTAKDGKVKAELGQDKDRTGSYSYSFTINNFSNEDLTYSFDTDMFTQDAYSYEDDFYAYQEYLDVYTWFLDANVRYYENVNGHDVDMDGDTDTDDVQAILDYVTGVNDGSNLDLEAAELDSIDGITSNDAQVLLQWIEAHENDLVLVPAGGSTEITVSIELDPEQEAMTRPNGAYVEGFTYIIPESVTEEGEVLDVVHSIPILGYYGSWTDPSMYDAASYLDNFYPTGKLSYFIEIEEEDEVAPIPVTNFMSVKYPGDKKDSVFMGNPYMVEDSFPYDRLAISSNTTVSSFTYSLIRNAAVMMPAAISEDGNLLYSGNVAKDNYGAFFHINYGVWQNTSPKKATVKKEVGDFGADEGDVFFLGEFAIPEYYGLYNDANAQDGYVTGEEIAELFSSGELGEGSAIGYWFKLDDTAPVINDDIKYNGDDGTLTVILSDDNYIADLRLYDVTGRLLLEELLPEQTSENETIEHTFNLTDYDFDYDSVIVFAADYAANETAKLVRLSDEQKAIPVFRLTDKLVPYNDYVIANTDKAGEGRVLFSNGQNYITSSSEVNVFKDAKGAYIYADEIDDASLWFSYDDGSDGIWFINENDGGLLGYTAYYYQMLGICLYVSWPDVNYADSYIYDYPYLLDKNQNDGSGMYYDANYEMFLYGYEYADNIYLYTLDYIVPDEDNASNVTLNAENVTLILNINDEFSFNANVEPIYLDDRSVSWSSSKESVVTIDENGKAKGLSVGTAVITAKSNRTPEISASAVVTVVENEPLDAEVYAQVAYEDGRIEFDKIDLNDMSTKNLGDAFSYFYGGGESGLYIYGNDTDDDLHMYEIKAELTDEGKYEISSIDYVDHLGTLNHEYTLLDVANIPYFTVEGENEGDDPTEFDYLFVGVTPSAVFELYPADEAEPISYFPVGSIFGDMVAVTFVGLEYDEDRDITWYDYLILNSEGTLYLFGIYGNPDGSMSGGYDEIGKINVLTIGDDLTAYSMVYAGGITNKAGIFISDATSGGIYYVDLSEETDEFDAQFVGRIDKAINISTLFDWYYDSYDGRNGAVAGEMLSGIFSSEEFGKNIIHSQTRETEDASGSIEETFVPEEIIPEEISDEKPVEVSETEPETGTVNTAVRMERKEKENIVRDPVPNRNTDVKEETDDGKDYSVVVYTEDVEVKNGYVTVSYDPKVAKFVGPEKGVQSPVDYTSVNVDEENGEIRFACAQLGAVAAGDAIAEFRFERVCEDSNVTVDVAERNKDLSLDEESKEKLKGLGHDWFFIGWNWESDELAYAEFRCSRDSSHGKSVRATVNVDRTEPTADKTGKIVYTAKAEFQGVEYVDSKTVILPATGHNGQSHEYEFVGFEWSEDGSKAVAVFKDLTTGETVRIDAQLSKTETPATYEAEGSIVYTAVVEYDGKTYTDSKKIVLDKLVDDTTNIDDDPIPTTEPENEGKKMSVLDALFVLATLGAGIYLATKKNFLGLIAAAISAVLFFVTQGFGNGTVFADKWSVPMGALLAIAFLVGLIRRKDDEDEEE
ncbi:MAG: S8 family serine peptidase [Erysipelotrichaceae bacterium]|nr:S8 family serine peptidase [Erysipelotrichaceae bacterium]